jgi:hypothetical protein
MSLSGWLPRAARAALAVLAFALPFELVRPLGHIGPLQLTSVELVLYVALAISAIAILMGGVRGGAPTLPLPNPPAMGSAKQSSASPDANLHRHRVHPPWNFGFWSMHRPCVKTPSRGWW